MLLSSNKFLDRGSKMNKILSIVFGLLFFVINSISAHDHHGKEGMGKGVHFKKMDTNSDNKVSKEEWQKFHDAHFAELDKDVDGSVSMEELKAFHEEKKSDREEKKALKKEEKKSGKK
jgi:hypothetical protein